MIAYGNDAMRPMCARFLEALRESGVSFDILARDRACVFLKMLFDSIGPRGSRRCGRSDECNFGSSGRRLSLSLVSSATASLATVASTFAAAFTPTVATTLTPAVATCVSPALSLTTLSLALAPSIATFLATTVSTLLARFVGSLSRLSRLGLFNLLGIAFRLAFGLRVTPAALSA